MPTMTPLQHLQRAAVIGALCDSEHEKSNLHRYAVTAWTLERDGRKRGRVVRKLMDDGMASPDQSGKPLTDEHKQFLPTQACLDSVDAHPLNLFAIWGNLYGQDGHSDRLKMPWVRAEDLTTEQLKEVCVHADDHQFYVIDSDPYRYSTNRFMDESKQVPDGKGGRCYWEGPMTLAEAKRRLPEVREQFGGQGMKGFEIVISSADLDKKISSHEFNEELERLLRCNLCWALVELGVMDKREVFDDQGAASENKDTPKITTAKRDSIFPSYTNLGDDPAQWEAVLEEQTGKIANRIEQLQAQQHLLFQLALKVAKYGGWDKFVLAYRGKLTEYLEEREAEGA